MAWNTPKTDWQAADVPSALDFNRIEENTRVVREDIEAHRQKTGDTHGVPAGDAIESKQGAQAKADAAEQAAKQYTDNRLENFEGMKSHGNEWHDKEFETTLGAQAKADQAEANAKAYADAAADAAEQAAKAASIPVAEKGAANGVATLDSSGKVPASQLPDDGGGGNGGGVSEHGNEMHTEPYATADQARTATTALRVELRTDDPLNPATGRIWLRTDLI